MFASQGLLLADKLNGLIREARRKVEARSDEEIDKEAHFRLEPWIAVMRHIQENCPIVIPHGRDTSYFIHDAEIKGGWSYASFADEGMMSRDDKDAVAELYRIFNEINQQSLGHLYISKIVRNGSGVEYALLVDLHDTYLLLRWGDDRMPSLDELRRRFEASQPESTPKPKSVRRADKKPKLSDDEKSMDRIRWHTSAERRKMVAAQHRFLVPSLVLVFVTTAVGVIGVSGGDAAVLPLAVLLSIVIGSLSALISVGLWLAGEAIYKVATRSQWRSNIA